MGAIGSVMSAVNDALAPFGVVDGPPSRSRRIISAGSFAMRRFEA